jgi:daunorubicin resistance ABC transporter ATP-binding subunit
MTSAIDVRGLRKSFGRTAVLDGLDLSVERGTVFALLGPNGAGKTTLISILSTLVAPDGGTAVVDGHDVVRDPAGVRRSIGLTGQSAAVDGMLTGAENLRMIGRLGGLGRRQANARAAELLARFDLTDAGRKRASTYSGGMRRRLDLALSLVVARPVIFLDEPTTGLDARSRLELWDVIRSLRADGTTVFLTTQYLEEADQLADVVAVLDHGVIVAEGTPDELKRRTGGEVVELRDDRDGLLGELPTDGSLAGLRGAIETLEQQHGEGAVTVRKPSLDDVFLALTGQPAPVADAAGSDPARKDLVRA